MNHSRYPRPAVPAVRRRCIGAVGLSALSGTLIKKDADSV